MEYGLSRKDISQALANEIITFDKSATIHYDISRNFSLTEMDIIASGDYYFYNFLNSKVKLTDLGIHILDTLKGGQFNKDANVQIVMVQVIGRKEGPRHFQENKASVRSIY